MIDLNEELKPRCIGLAGPKGVGKTTSALLLQDYGWIRLSFAEPLRRMLLAMGLSLYEIERKEEPLDWLENKNTPRQLLQTLGTEWGRSHVGPNIWVDLAERHAVALLEKGYDVVFDDVRFDNEALMINRLAVAFGGGGVYKLKRDLDNSSIDLHPSEKGISRVHIKAEVLVTEPCSICQVVA